MHWSTHRLVVAVACLRTVKKVENPHCISLEDTQNQWHSEDVRGPWTTDSLGPLPILHYLIPLIPPPLTPYSDFAHVFSLLYDLKIRHFLISTHIMV